MKNTQRIYFLIMILVYCNCGGSTGNKQNSLKLPKDISNPVEAINRNGKEYEEEDTLYASLNKLDFIVYPNGQIDQFENINGNKKTTYFLKTKNMVTKVFLYFYANKLIVYYSDSDFDTGASFVESFSFKTQKRLWHANTFGFNLGLPVNKGNISYISTIGFVGKLNLDTGKYFWKHSNLYDHETYSFNSFDSVIFKEENTIFISKNHIDKSIDSIIVNDKNGILSIRK